MSASEKSGLKSAPALPHTVGVIAGGGSLPLRLIESCEKKGISLFVIGFEGQTDPAIIQGRNHMWTRLGAAGHIMKTLKRHDVTDLVMIGAIRRPSLAELVPDFKTIEFFARIGMKALGDNDLLGAIRTMLEREGFRLHGVQAFADDLLARQGSVGQYEPAEGDWVDIRRGAEVLMALGLLDVGQSVIVQEGMVLGVEAAEGTDELIRRCGPLKRKGRGGVLVKLCKPQQDRDLDMPTVGPQTLNQAAEAGLAGVCIHAGHSLLVDPDEVAKIADRHKMFLVGISPDELLSKTL
jgi:DUF1009 family protein